MPVDTPEIDSAKGLLIVGDKDIVEVITQDVENSIPKLGNGIYGPTSSTTTRTFDIPKITVTDHKITAVSKTTVTVSPGSHCSYCSYCGYCGNNHCTKCPTVTIDCKKCSWQSSHCAAGDCNCACNCDCACDGCMN